MQWRNVTTGKIRRTNSIKKKSSTQTAINNDKTQSDIVQKIVNKTVNNQLNDKNVDDDDDIKTTTVSYDESEEKSNLTRVHSSSYVGHVTALLRRKSLSRPISQEERQKMIAEAATNGVTSPKLSATSRSISIPEKELVPCPFSFDDEDNVVVDFNKIEEEKMEEKIRIRKGRSATLTLQTNSELLPQQQKEKIKTKTLNETGCNNCCSSDECRMTGNCSKCRLLPGCKITNNCEKCSFKNSHSSTTTTKTSESDFRNNLPKSNSEKLVSTKHLDLASNGGICSNINTVCLH